MTDCTTCSNDYATYQYDGDACPVCVLKAQRDEICGYAAKLAMEADKDAEPHVQVRRAQEAWQAESRRITPIIMQAMDTMRVLFKAPPGWTPPAR